MAEGFTAYFDDLLVRRSGIISQTRYLEVVATHWTKVLQNAGRHRQSLSESGADAWIRLYRPHPNLGNVTQNYYVNGAVAACYFDAQVRLATEDRELDDVLRELYSRSYLHNRGYSRDDIVGSFRHVAPDVDWEQRVAETVDVPLDMDFAGTLSAAYGIDVELDDGHRPSLGIQVRSGTTEVALVRDGEAGRSAGLLPGDEMLAIDGIRLRSSNWPSVFDSVLRVGKTSELLISREGLVRSVSAEPRDGGVRSVFLRPRPDADAAQMKRRAQWLDARV